MYWKLFFIHLFSPFLSISLSMTIIVKARFYFHPSVSAVALKGFSFLVLWLIFTRFLMHLFKCFIITNSKIFFLLGYITILIKINQLKFWIHFCFSFATILYCTWSADLLAQPMFSGVAIQLKFDSNYSHTTRTYRQAVCGIGF